MRKNNTLVTDGPAQDVPVDEVEFEADRLEEFRAMLEDAVNA